MTYRQGAYVWDELHGRVGVVMEGNWCGKVHLRPVGGGKEWTSPARMLRLATRPEKAAAGVKGDG
ncbi:hypothetical protein ABT168_21760 [Streptomyces sp. NPDC001793]|uniref:hypothetical protein n=1 Tax=Streptomyces sp. NPDC001793 TaxID=3154657 RepID=UPI003321CB96